MRCLKCKGKGFVCQHGCYQYTDCRHCNGTGRKDKLDVEKEILQKLTQIENWLEDLYDVAIL